VGRPGTLPTWVGLKKNKGRKNLVQLGKTRSKTRLQPVDFCFFIKRRCFGFFKKNDLGDRGLGPGRVFL
jgi:hypothetical protein